MTNSTPTTPKHARWICDPWPTGGLLTSAALFIGQQHHAEGLRELAGQAPSLTLVRWLLLSQVIFAADLNQRRGWSRAWHALRQGQEPPEPESEGASVPEGQPGRLRHWLMGAAHPGLGGHPESEWSGAPGALIEQPNGALPNTEHVAASWKALRAQLHLIDQALNDACDQMTQLSLLGRTQGASKDLWNAQRTLGLGALGWTTEHLSVHVPVLSGLSQLGREQPEQIAQRQLQLLKELKLTLALTDPWVPGPPRSTHDEPRGAAAGYPGGAA